MAQKSTGELVTAGDWNEVERRYARNATVATNQSTTSTVYIDLATTGPSVTVTTSTSVLVILTAYLYGAADGNQAIMGVAVSGATTIAASDIRTLRNANVQAIMTSATFLLTGLTAGSNTFTAKYRTSAGTATFEHRSILVIPI